ncbi:MAG: hypothetical protein WAO76_00180 [Georgfuchsia sp.]
MNIIKSIAIIFAVALLPANHALAGTYTDNLTRCLADSTTGKDRKDLGRWIFSLMSLNPYVASIAPVKKSDRESATRTAATIYRRLLAQDCKKEVKDTIEHEGNDALKAGLDTLGKLAIQELMSDPNVQKAAADFGKYISKPDSE